MTTQETEMMARLLYITCIHLILVVQSKVDLPTCLCQNVRRNYRGYQVLAITPFDNNQNDFIRTLQRDNELDFWLPATPRFTQVLVLVPPQRIAALTERFQILGIQVEIHTADVQRLIDQFTFPPSQLFNYNEFNPFEQIEPELFRLANACPGYLACNVQSIGVSWEGRPLNVLTISTGGSSGRSLWIDSLTHAREWLAGATTMKIFDRLIREYLTNPEAAKIVNRYDHIYFLPVVNPDGYAFSWTNDRMWRKNRRPGATCYLRGVDLNRNFASNWGGVSGDFVSDLECDDTYQGPSEASEPEVQAIQNFLSSKSGIEVFFTFHSFGRYLLLPYGDCSKPANYADTLAVASATVAAIEAEHNTAWSEGNSCDLIYETAGSSRDWAQEVLNVPYSYTAELRGNDFIVDPSQIQLSFEELWVGLVALVANIPLGVGMPP